ncbi:MmgE/PrpD family protein [Roseobacteraceae bacterium S113]
MTFDEIADFALGQPDIPESAMRFGATLLIDTLGVGAGAHDMEPGRIARDHVARFMRAERAEDSATLLFDGRVASIPGAAFALATQIDNLDAHDGYNPTKGHIGCAVVPALCAFAETQPELSGRDAVAALVISYELAARAAIALHASVSDYHTSGAWNALGVAALGARLRGLSTDQLRHALGIAEYHGPRSQMMREIANPTMLHDGSGPGALIGAMAALMAEEGFEGAPAITVEAEDVAAHWADLGRLWTVELNYIKPYPICRWAHASLDAIAMLQKAHGLSASDIASVTLNTFAEASALYPGVPQSTSQAQYSLPFACAVMLTHGVIAPHHIAEQNLSDPRVAEMLARISVIEEPRHSERFPVGRWSDVVITTTDGRSLASGDIHARGGPEAPMEDSEVAAKFDLMAAPLAKERRDAIWAMRDKLLEPETGFSDLLALLKAAA